MSVNVRDFITVNIDAMPDHVYQRDIRKQLCCCYPVLDHRYPCANHGDTAEDIATARDRLHAFFRGTKASASNYRRICAAAYSGVIDSVVKDITERNSGVGGDAP